MITKGNSRHMGGALQYYSQRVIMSIFDSGDDDVTVRSNYRSSDLKVTSEEGRSMEIDVYLPDYKLGFEYQVCVCVYVCVCLYVRCS